MQSVRHVRGHSRALVMSPGMLRRDISRRFIIIIIQRPFAVYFNKSNKNLCWVFLVNLTSVKRLPFMLHICFHATVKPVQLQCTALVDTHCTVKSIGWCQSKNRSKTATVDIRTNKHLVKGNLQLPHYSMCCGNEWHSFNRLSEQYVCASEYNLLYTPKVRRQCRLASVYSAKASRAHSQPGLRPRPPLNINALCVNLVNIDKVHNTVEENSSVFSLIRMRWLPSARACGQ